MAKTFSEQVDDMIVKTDARMLALFRETLQRIIDDAQTPVAKGGKMHVDTGFLRASGAALLTGMPSGPVRGGETQKYNFDESTVIVQLGQLKLGDTFYFGWTANYAVYREAYDGFLASAMAKFPGTVAKVTDEIKAKIT